MNEVVERRRKGDVKGGSEGEDEEVGEEKGKECEEREKGKRGKRGKEGGGRRERAVNRWWKRVRKVKGKGRVRERIKRREKIGGKER